MELDEGCRSTHPECCGHSFRQVDAQRVHHHLNVLVDGVRPCCRPQHSVDLHERFHLAFGKSSTLATTTKVERLLQEDRFHYLSRLHYLPSLQWQARQGSKGQ